MSTRLAFLPPLLILSSLLALLLGSVRLSPGEVIAVLAGLEGVEPAARAIVLTLRLPRLLTAIGAGAGLSVAGLLMQTVFRNGLAGPGVLGVSSGASLGVALVMLTGLGAQLSAASFVAASLGAGIVLSLALLVNRVIEEPVVLLVLGLVFGYAANAGTTLLMASSPAEGLERYIAWSFGSFALPPGPGPLLLAGGAVGFGLFLSLLGKRIDVLLLGPAYTESSGIHARRTQGAVIIAAGAATGLVTAMTGPISFIGVAVPHLARGFLGSSRHRALAPATALLGATLAVVADLVARLPGTDQILPLNAVMAIVGAPVVLTIILRRSLGTSEGGVGL
ncbi:MAG: FecCD family ABC transporter permease [Spirochaetaceae bacterium]